jgi:NADH:ubiquinone oxidoreductase subunit H
LAEYGNLLIRAALTHIIWVNWSGVLLMWIVLWFVFRACYPRIRFDKIMSMTWIILLPIVLFLWVFYLHIYSF